jgi:NADH-quinone oxidoreductase subunit K
MSEIPISWYLFVSAALFGLGVVSIIARRNLIYVLIGVELILNACNLNFVAFASQADEPLDGRMFAVFVIILAVAEAAVALAIVLNIFGLFDSIRPDDPDLLRE